MAHVLLDARQSLLFGSNRPSRGAVCCCSTSRVTSNGRSNTFSLGKEQLLRLISDQRFGAACTQQQNQQVLDLVAQLQAAQDALGPWVTAPTDGPLAGDWHLLWTTEQSVHQIVRGQLLAPVVDIQQDIDLEHKRVTNKIFFGWLGLQLQASGPLTVLSSSRFFYNFDKLVLHVGQGLKFDLPVLFKGGGWSEVVFFDTETRIMKNSRQDTLIFQRH